MCWKSLFLKSELLDLGKKYTLYVLFFYFMYFLHKLKMNMNILGKVFWESKKWTKKMSKNRKRQNSVVKMRVMTA